jgi:hypothetical protein
VSPDASEVKFRPGIRLYLTRNIPRSAVLSNKPESKSGRLRELIHRQNKVLAIVHPPTAAHARIMEKPGCEALFVGTGGMVGACTD